VQQTIDQMKQALSEITSGEWETSGHCVVSPNPDENRREDYAEVCIADCHDEPLDEAQIEANARFIALAHRRMPQLLELVEAVNEAIDEDGDLRGIDLGRVVSAMNGLRDPA
jgi:hypothetical protein